MSSSDRTASPAPWRRARRAVAAWRTSAVLAGGLALAACGGGGGEGGGTDPGTSTATAQFNVATSFQLASGTSGLALRVTPTYERTTGGAGALATQSPALSGTGAQAVSLPVDVTACMRDAAHAGGAGVCQVRLAAALYAGDRLVDSLAFGPYSVQNGTVTAVTAAFVEVAGVRVTLDGATVPDGGAVSVALGATRTPTAVALDPAGNALAARPVRWTSEAPGIAAVDATTGVITGAGAGTARVVASSFGRTSAFTVTVAAPPRTLTVALAGTGSGSVTGTGIDCRANNPAGCTASVAGGATVRLTVAADANSTFAGWGGACTGTAITCDVVMTEARSVTATFTRRQVTISLQANGPGAGTVTLTGGNAAGCLSTTVGAAVACTATVDQGATVTVTAAAAAGNVASAWTGGVCSGSATTPCSFTASGNATVQATFASAAAATGAQNISVLSNGSSPVAVDLAYDRQLNGRQQNSGQFSPVLESQNPQPHFSLSADTGSPVTLRVRPRNGVGRIVSWGGACAGQPVSATFAECTYTAAPGANVTVTLSP